jgi:hypothetical protein
MKCNRYAIWGWKSRKSSENYPPVVLGSFPDLIHAKKSEEYGFKFLSKLELCEGEIISEIELEYIPYYGGANPNIEVRFVCNKCKYDHAGFGLPRDINSLNDFITEVISKL